MTRARVLAAVGVAGVLALSVVGLVPREAPHGWAVFRSEAAALAYGARVDRALGYPRGPTSETIAAPPAMGLWPTGRDPTKSEHAALAAQVRGARRGDPGYGWTTRHGEPRKHPAAALWAYPLAGVPASVKVPSGAEKADDLGPDWTPVVLGP